MANMATAAGELEIIERLEDIPEFASESEEADYWATHQLSEDLWAEFGDAPDDLPPTGTIYGLRLSLAPDVSQRLRVLAKKKGVSYATLAKQFVLERLYEEEKREGIIGEREAS